MDSLVRVSGLDLSYFCVNFNNFNAFYLTTHTATPELPEIRNAYHSVLVFLLLSVDMFLSLCGFIECGICGLHVGYKLTDIALKGLLICTCVISLDLCCI